MPNATQPVLSESSQLLESRSTAPVFVVGCPRSGTTLLYHMLLSAGNFAIYRTESQVFHTLEAGFGDLGDSETKKKLLPIWFKSRLFTATGLNAEALQERIMRDCRNAGDFLRITMEEAAQAQGVKRWAECTPDHILYLPRIKQTIPNALVIHIIRDGRDVALSMEKQGWPKQLPWDRGQRRMAGGLYWEWMIRKGRKEGAQLGPDYIEVRYEDLVSQPREVLTRLSSFIEQELDYDEIQKVGIGSVSRPNTSFQDERGASPVGRWEKIYSEDEIAVFEAMVGKTLDELAYGRSTRISQPSFGSTLFETQYQAAFELKFQLRANTPLGRWLVNRDLSRM